MVTQAENVKKPDDFIQQLARLVLTLSPEVAVEVLLHEAHSYLNATQVSLWVVDRSTHRAVIVNAVPKTIPHELFPHQELTQAVTHLSGTANEPSRVTLIPWEVWLFPFSLRSCEGHYVASVVSEGALPEEAVNVLTVWLALLQATVEQSHVRASLQVMQKHAEQRIQQVTALYEIGQAMEKGDLQSLLDMITRKATEVMEAHTCSLMLLDEDEQALVIRSSYGLPETIIEQTRVPWGKGIAGKVAASGESMLILDPRTDHRLAGDDVTYREDIVASLCVPLRNGQGQVHGVLNIHRRKPAPVFTEQDMRLFTVFAMQAASAIKNTQLYNSLMLRVHELSALSDLSAAVNSTLELEKILQKTADSIVDTVQFDRCAIFLLDDTGRLVVPHALRGYRPETLGSTSVRVADGVIGTVVRNQELLLVEDAQRASQPARGFGRMLGVKSFLVAPIVARDRVIGAVVADNKPSNRPINRTNIQLLTTFMNQAGMAIENARLYNDLEHRFRQLHNLWEYTRNLLSSIGVGVMSIDREGYIRTWNPAAERITGIAQSVALGHRVDELAMHLSLPKKEQDFLLDVISTPFATGERRSEFKCALHLQQRGERYFNMESSPLHAPDGSVQGVVCMFEDITHQVHMEKEMQRVNQLAAVGQLASTIAHELRNPLSSIRAAAQHLRGKYGSSEDLREFLGIIISEVDALNTMATDFLEFARPMLPVPQEIQLRETIETTLQLMMTYLQECNVQVETHFSELPVINADPVLLKQALRNLINNAVQAMPDGGTLTIRTAPAGPDNIEIVVKDTGSGIAQEHLDQIFIPFFSTRTKGTGLGLPLVEKIVKNHGGAISVQSQVGVGTEVHITLPRQPLLHHHPAQNDKAGVDSVVRLRTEIPDI